MNAKKFLFPSLKENFSEWYQMVIEKSELAMHSEVRGCMIVLPYGYAIWENIQKELGIGIKKLGAQNMAFPLLIPYSFFEREKEHVDGFAPEIAVVTHAGGEKLSEPLVVRPTSEVIVHSYFKEKIFSWRDLPLMINQWCSVVRWEKRPRLFLRTSEFWWQEGHCAFGNRDMAEKNLTDAIELYHNFCADFLAIPSIIGNKPEHERFAGAEITMTIEGMMQDGKALQMGTSHLLEQSFSKASGIEFQDKEQKMCSPWLTSWGVTTRLIGALIMVHGDQKGLVIPPKIAPYLIVILPIFSKDEENNSIIEVTVAHITELLTSCVFSFFIDRSDKPFGEKLFETEAKGYPFRLEIGIRDIEAGRLNLFERDICQKTSIPLSYFSSAEDLKRLVDEKIFQMQERMLLKAKLFQEKNTYEVSSIHDIQDNGFYKVFWCGKDIEKIKEKQLTVRCVLEKVNKKSCFIHSDCYCEYKFIVAKSY